MLLPAEQLVPFVPVCLGLLFPLVLSGLVSNNTDKPPCLPG